MTERVSRVLYRSCGCYHLSCLYVTVKLCATNEILSGKHRLRAFVGVASNRVYMALCVTVESVSSYLAFPSLPDMQAVYFCCTFPEVTLGGRYPLSLPYEARTFLTVIPFGNIPRDCPIQSKFIITKYKIFVKAREKVYKRIRKRTDFSSVL